MPPVAKTYLYKGKMLLATEIAEKRGLNIQTVYRRIQTGKTLEERKNNTCFFKGKIRTLKEVSDMVNLTVSTVRDKLANNQPITRLEQYEGKKYNFHGEMKSIKQISDITGLKLTTVYQRIYHNKSFEDVFRSYRTKTCTSCNQTKNINHFAKDGSNIKNHPYYRGECNPCRNERQRNHS